MPHSDVPADLASLVDLLRLRIDEPATLGIRFLAGRDTSELTFGELDRRARAVAVALAEQCRPGDRALLCYPPGLEFMVGLFGSLYAGLVAVPAYPPRAHKPDARLASMAASCRPGVVLGTKELVADRERLLTQTPALAEVPWVATSAVSSLLGEAWVAQRSNPTDLAILQYTSGSTGDPKGVMLTHACALHNIAGISRSMGLGRGSIGVSWLPAFHDMGLIGNLLGVIWYPGLLHLLSPLAMLQDPFRWLDAVSSTGAYISGGPCFAYEQCLERITSEQRRRLDLSRWKVAYVGAEPISPRVLDEFARTFAECGFQRSSFYPCFGLAESSLMVTGVEAGRGPLVRAFDASGLERDRVVPAENGRVLVGCGKPIDDLTVAIVDPQSCRSLPEDRVGEIWVHGPSVAAGYFERDNATEATFRGRLGDDADRCWLRTGDLGFLAEGELFIAGRLKDVLIIRGRNYYPQDVEEVVGLASPLLRSALGAAFTQETDTGARLVLVYEVARNHKPGSSDVFAAVRAAVAEEFGLELSELVLIRSGTLPRTSSGKVARRETRQRHLANDLEVVERFEAPPEVIPEAATSVTSVHEWLVERLARQLSVDRSVIDPERPFAAYGLDSLAMVRIAGELERWLGRPLSPTLLYSAPTVASLARALAGQAVSLALGNVTPSDTRIALVGIGCRFPGADGPEAFWDLLREGRSAIRELPGDRVPERWNAARDHLTTTRGGYLEDVKGFDASFFGIPPREASWIDPQHRLLLEVAHHALEDAGLAVDQLAGSMTGVFVGISGADYARLISDRAAPEMFLATGNAASMAAHRLSYHLDFHGPSLSIDTACSSSLTAVHHACQALRNGDCDLALAAGVNLILLPEITEALSRAQMLSPSARCKTFDATADGYVRGEGVGVVVLKPLALAQRDGDPIYAVLEASVVNQDGRSNGITAPNGAAQTALVKTALARAGRTAEEISFVETHGTGTSLGDPIEFEALNAALGEASPPCILGAVKSNIGHLEAAAGIAGLIKTALQIEHGQIAPVVGLGHVNPRIPLDGSRFELPRSLTVWPAERHPLAGVSSFGFGGTNALVLLSKPAARPVANTSNSACAHLVPLSARSETALRDLARNTAAWVSTHEVTLADVARTAALGRTHFPHRLVAVAADRAELARILESWAGGKREPAVQTGRALADRVPRVAFLFTGQGSARAGMARLLDQQEPVFRATLDRCAKCIQDLAGWSLREVLDDPVRIDETEFAQPALFAFEVSLAQLWQSWGVEPTAVLGHSVGEYAAACIAGVLSVEDGLRLMLERGRLMQGCSRGGMLACLASAEQVRSTLERYEGRVVLATINGPSQVVLAGDPGALAAVAMELTELRITSKSLRVSRAFHSPLIDPALPGLRALAQSLNHQAPRVALVSNLTGEVLSAAPTPDYWALHARDAVQFEAGMKALERLEITHLVEIGPAAVLTRLGASCLPGYPAAWLPSFEGEQGEPAFRRGLARLHADGAKLDWLRLEGAGQRTRLPGYPFQHRDYWLDDLPRNARSLAQPVVETVPPPVTDWRPRSNWKQCLPRFVPAFDRLPVIVAPALEATCREHSLEQAVRLRPEFDRLAGSYITGAFVRLGWRPVVGEDFTLTSLAGRLGVVGEKHRLLGRLLELCAEDGWIDWAQERGTVRLAPPVENLEALHADLRERYRDFDVELRLAHHCARHLADVLRGTVDPLQVLFEGEAGRLTSEIYSRAPVARFYNALLTRAVGDLVDALPQDRPLRVLELGAGTGGTTQALLPVLPAGRTEYVFTDVSSLFLARARTTFAAFDFVDYQTLDLERLPAEQGFAPGQFDLIVASNVLHATADLRLSVQHARSFLAPGGLLVLLEGTGPRRLLDLIFGLTEGWWRFRDDGLRPHYPLLGPAEWRRLLHEEGFESVMVVPEGDPRLPNPDQAVLLARMPITSQGEAMSEPPGQAREWVLIGADSPLAQALNDRLAAWGNTPRRLASLGGERMSPGSSVVFLPGAEPPSGFEFQAWKVTLGVWPDQPQPLVRWIDLDPARPAEEQAAVLAEALSRPDAEAVMVYRGDQRYLPRALPAATVAEEKVLPEVEAPSRQVLLAASPFERRALVEGYLRQELARLIGTTIRDEDMDLPVQSLGLDSLMAIQVRNRVETSLGVALSLVDFLKGLRVRQLVDGIVAQLAEAATPSAPAEPEIAAAVPVATGEVGALSESELDSLLVSLLDQPQDAG